MTRLILIRHAPTQPDATVAAHSWLLSDHAETCCVQLANELCAYSSQHVYSSHEQKAIQTAQYLAQALGVSYSVAPNLEETQRHSTHYYPNPDAFSAKVIAAMQAPEQLIFGDETFSHARARFSKQIDILASTHHNQTVAIVSHGRILAMFLAMYVSESPQHIWQQLGMPAYAILDWQHKRVEKIVYRIAVST